MPPWKAPLQAKKEGPPEGGQYYFTYSLLPVLAFV